MTVSTISNLSVQSSLTSALQAEATSLNQLTVQLSTQQQHTNLTDYSASDARNLVNLQASATQAQAYINVMSGVSSNLSIYNTTLTDLESITTQAQQLAENDATYTPATASDVLIQSTNFLTSTTVDLNQQINGVYIYSGTRYNTAPVQNLTTLPTSSLTPTIYTDGSTVPSYDSASTMTESVSGQDVTIGGTPAVGQTASITVDGTTYNYTVQSGDSTDDVAANLGALVPGASVSGSDITIGAGDTINSATATAASTSAYTTSKATIANNDTVNYGITSNDPAMQQMVAGLRFLQAAGNATDATTYQNDIQQAASLLTSALSSLQTLNTTVAYNINTMQTEQKNQTAAISDLTNQVDDIQQVDVTQVSTEITAMEAILQASYAVTGDIEKMSIVNYLA